MSIGPLLADSPRGRAVIAQTTKDFLRREDAAECCLSEPTKYEKPRPFLGAGSSVNGVILTRVASLPQAGRFNVVNGDDKCPKPSLLKGRGGAAPPVEQYDNSVKNINTS